MKFKYLFFLAQVLGAVNSALAYQPVNASDSDAVTVKIGPPVLGALISPEETFKISLEKKFKKKEEEEAVFRQYLEAKQLQSLLNDTEVYSQSAGASLTDLNELLQSFQEQKDLHGQMLVLNSYGVYYAKNADLAKGIQFFKQSLQLQEKVNKRTDIARMTETLATLSMMNSCYEDAIFYTRYNSRINSSLNNPAGVAEDYIKIGQIQALKKEYKDAEYSILRKAFPLFQRMGNKEGRMSCFENLGKLYGLQEEFSKAKWFYLQANIMAVKLNNIPAQISSLMEVAQIKKATGNPDMALADYKEAERLAEEYNEVTQLIEIKGYVGEIYRTSGNYLAANIALDEYNQLKKDLLQH